MRKVVYGYNVSLDGFIEDRDGTIEWTEPGPELHRWFNESERNTDVQIYGRRLWETMKVWADMLGDESLPPEMQEYAELWNKTPTVVFSRTMTEAPPGVRLLRELLPPRHLRDEPALVGHEDERALVRLQRFGERLDRIEVEMVGRLV